MKCYAANIIGLILSLIIFYPITLFLKAFSNNDKFFNLYSVLFLVMFVVTFHIYSNLKGRKLSAHVFFGIGAGYILSSFSYIISSIVIKGSGILRNIFIDGFETFCTINFFLFGWFFGGVMATLVYLIKKVTNKNKKHCG